MTRSGQTGRSTSSISVVSARHWSSTRSSWQKSARGTSARPTWKPRWQPCRWCAVLNAANEVAVAAFLAGQAFKVYRLSKGAKTSPMPDFYIGAHAIVRNLQLLTRDAARYRSYFPRLKIVAP